MVKVGVGSETNLEGGKWFNTGKHHCLVETVEEVFEKGHALRFEFAGLGASEGQKHSEFFQLEGRALGKFINLAIATKVITREQAKAAQQSGEDLDIDEAQMIGRDLFVDVEENEHEGKVRHQIGFNSYAKDDARCKDWFSGNGQTKKTDKPKGKPESGGSAPSGGSESGGDPYGDLFG